MSSESLIIPDEVTVNLSEAYERGRIDINFFAALCIPTVCIFELPPFYVAIWSLFANRSPEQMNKLLRFVLGLPRGHAKTTFIKILITWLIVYDKYSFPLIICANKDLAELLVADIHDILCSDNITQIYGSWEDGLAIDSADTKKGIYHGRSVSIVARGWTAGIRGMNLKHQRPDIIFCDDAQTRENDKSPTERQKLLEELTGSIFKALKPFGNRLLIYVGNMYSDECILNQFAKNTQWISLITGAILEDGTPLWTELFSLEELMESYTHDAQLGLAHIWFAEVMNDPQSQAKSLLPEPLPSCPIDEDNLVDPDGVFITIDPAGFRKDSDDNVISVHYKQDDKGFVGKTILGIMKPDEIVMNALNLAEETGASLIAVEDTGYQQTLGFWLTFFMNQLNMQGITVVPVSHHGRSKETRIRQFIAELYSGNYYLLDKDTMAKFIWQASMYKVGKKDNKDDLLDAIAYGQDVRNEYWHLLTNLKRIISSSLGEARVIGYNTGF